MDMRKLIQAVDQQSVAQPSSANMKKFMSIVESAAAPSTASKSSKPQSPKLFEQYMIEVQHEFSASAKFRSKLVNNLAERAAMQVNRRVISENDAKVAEAKKKEPKPLMRTTDLLYHGWDLRWENYPKPGTKELQGMATDRGGRRAQIRVTGGSVDEVKDKLTAEVDAAIRKSAAIRNANVSIDFNTVLSRELAEYGGEDLFCTIVEWKGSPYLVVSDEPQHGLQRINDRRNISIKLANPDGAIYGFTMRPTAAQAVGLLHARYTLGPAEKLDSGEMVFRLEFHSSIDSASFVQLREPALTVVSSGRRNPDRTPATVAAPTTGSSPATESTCESCQQRAPRCNESCQLMTSSTRNK